MNYTNYQRNQIQAGYNFSIPNNNNLSYFSAQTNLNQTTYMYSERVIPVRPTTTSLPPPPPPPPPINTCIVASTNNYIPSRIYSYNSYGTYIYPLRNRIPFHPLQQGIPTFSLPNRIPVYQTQNTIPNFHPHNGIPHRNILSHNYKGISSVMEHTLQTTNLRNEASNANSALQTLLSASNPQLNECKNGDNHVYRNVLNSTSKTIESYLNTNSTRKNDNQRLKQNIDQLLLTNTQMLNKDMISATVKKLLTGKNAERNVQINCRESQRGANSENFTKLACYSSNKKEQSTEKNSTSQTKTSKGNGLINSNGKFGKNKNLSPSEQAHSEQSLIEASLRNPNLILSRVEEFFDPNSELSQNFVREIINYKPKECMEHKVQKPIDPRFDGEKSHFEYFKDKVFMKKLQTRLSRDAIRYKEYDAQILKYQSLNAPMTSNTNQNCHLSKKSVATNESFKNSESVKSNLSFESANQPENNSSNSSTTANIDSISRILNSLDIYPKNIDINKDIDSSDQSEPDVFDMFVKDEIDHFIWKP